jgi:hypothetical protein
VRWLPTVGKRHVTVRPWEDRSGCDRREVGAGCGVRRTAWNAAVHGDARGMNAGAATTISPLKRAPAIAIVPTAEDAGAASVAHPRRTPCLDTPSPPCGRGGPGGEGLARPRRRWFGRRPRTGRIKHPAGTTVAPVRNGAERTEDGIGSPTRGAYRGCSPGIHAEASPRGSRPGHPRRRRRLDTPRPLAGEGPGVRAHRPPSRTHLPRRHPRRRRHVHLQVPPATRAGHLVWELHPPRLGELLVGAALGAGAA